MNQQIKHKSTGKTLFECEVPDEVVSGFCMRHALEQATDAYADLTGADLTDADLIGADRATDERAIANLDKVRSIVLDNNERLEMRQWHDASSDWINKTCAEEALCETTHCLAGWLQVCSTDDKMRAMEPLLAGIFSAPVAAKMFFRQADEVLSWLDERKYVAEIAEESERREARKAAKESQE